MCGNKTQTSTSAQTTTPINQAALQGIFNQVQGAAQTPYTPYTGELTAPVNAQQTSGINNVNANANYASPYIQQAAGLTQGAAQPLTAQQIQQYQNPYTQNVVDATQAQFNESNGQQQQQVKGNAALAGALGGDRQAVAQAETARQQKLAQDPVIAGLYQNSYNSGLQTAGQQFQQNPLAAASQIGNLGVSGQNAALQGAGQQINAGTLQQQTQQAADTSNYGQYQAAQAFPYQQAQFLEQYGLPSALAQGTTSNGTQTSPGPNTFSQIAGLGIAGAGLFLKDGGAVNGYAPGGDVGYINSKNGYIFGAPGYIPTANGPAQNTLHAPTLQYAKPSTANPFDSSVKGLNSLSGSFSGEAYGGGNALTDAYGGSSSSPLEGLSAADYGEGFKIGGLVHAIHSIHRSIKRSRGGAVGSTPFQGFDNGGDVSFDDRFAPAVDSPFGDLSRGSAIQLLNNSRDGIQAPASIPGGEPAPSDVINPDNPYRMPDEAAVQAWRDGVDHPNAAIAADVPPSGDTTTPDANPMRVKLPPQISNPDNAPEEDSSPALAYDSTSRQGPLGANGLPTVTAPIGQDANQQHFGHSLLGANISDKTRQALVAAGLGIMASRSPFALSAIGEGGLQGLKSFSDSNKLEQDASDKAQSRQMEQQRIDLQAKQIAQNAFQFGKTNSLAERREKFSEDKTPTGYRQKDDGSYEAIKGGPADVSVVKAQAEAKRVANAVLDDDTIHDMADQYLAGDRTVMQNLGRGAQGAENIVKLRQAIAQHARDQGVDPAGIVNRFNEQAGALAGQRTVGARAANISLAANEANNMIPIALAASEKLPRSQYMPWNRMVQSVQRGTSSPELASFVAATNSLVNSYVRAVSPSGVPTDSMREHAYSMLNSAQGPEAYKAVVATMQQEMRAALQAPGQVKEELRKGNAATAAGVPASPPALASKPASVIQNGHTYTLQPDGSYK